MIRRIRLTGGDDPVIATFKGGEWSVENDEDGMFQGILEGMTEIMYPTGYDPQADKHFVDRVAKELGGVVLENPEEEFVEGRVY